MHGKHLCLNGSWRSCVVLSITGPATSNASGGQRYPTHGKCWCVAMSGDTSGLLPMVRMLDQIDEAVNLLTECAMEWYIAIHPRFHRKSTRVRGTALIDAFEEGYRWTPPLSPRRDRQAHGPEKDADPGNRRLCSAGAPQQQCTCRGACCSPSRCRSGGYS